jgi:hypothetical protein
MMTFDKVRRDATPVMCLSVPDQPDEIGDGWQRLEEIVGLRGRRFFGAFDHGQYRVCVAVRDGDDPDSLGLDRWVLPGGWYLRSKLRGEPGDLYDQIAPAFSALEQAAIRDERRPGIECYRRRDEIDLLLPVPDGA